MILAQGWGDFIQWLEGHQASAEVFLAVAALALTAGLVWATWTYARLTREMAEAARQQAEAARQQAEASVEMAREMRRQTLAEEEQAAEAKIARVQQIRPMVSVVRRESMTRDKQLSRGVCREIAVLAKNTGKGEAVNGTAALEWAGWPFTKHEDWRLAPNEERKFVFSRLGDTPQEAAAVRPRIVFEYQDLNGVRSRSGRELRVLDQTGDCDLGKEFGPEGVSS